MKVSIIRHGMTEANERRLYCGYTDLPLSEQGKRSLVTLKEIVVYPTAAMYTTSGLTRTSETLRILYGRKPDVIIEEFREMDFGEFEMKSYDDLKNKPEYQNWINDENSAACHRGESRDIFENRVIAGLNKLSVMGIESFVVVCHGGVIVSIMERLFPGQKNFYEWQPGFGRGYTIDIFQGSAALISEV